MSDMLGRFSTCRDFEKMVDIITQCLGFINVEMDFPKDGSTTSLIATFVDQCKCAKTRSVRVLEKTSYLCNASNDSSFIFEEFLFIVFEKTGEGERAARSGCVLTETVTREYI